ncbi:MAG TPA: hypothetical protein VGH89_13310 [Pseudonocardia sp.]|jgi:hypothetical protein
MSIILLMAGLSALAAAAMWWLDRRLDSGAATSRARWCCGAYLSTVDGRTLIISGGGIGIAAIAVTEPTPPVPVRDAAPPWPNTQNPAALAATDVPTSTPRPGPPQTDNGCPTVAELADAAELVDLAELEQLWQLPSRCRTATPVATPPAAEVHAPGQETPA